MIDSAGSERQKALPFFLLSLLFCFHLLFFCWSGAPQSSKVAGWARCCCVSQAGWKKRGPCELSRSIASNLQACPTWPQGPPTAHCHDGQLQQLINYAEAINALGKHSSNVLLLSISLSLCTPPPPTPILIQCAETEQPYTLSTGGIYKGNERQVQIVISCDCVRNAKPCTPCAFMDVSFCLWINGCVVHVSLSLLWPPTQGWLMQQ